ncbi:MAG TPA: FUSC family protein [Pseudacidobacterium sp.]|nr:FUSC family protein [Pseudacidobacterium sp.]
MSSPAPPGQPSQTPASSTAAYFTDSFIFNWANRTFRDDLIFVPPIAICLGTGLLSHHPAAGMIAAGGAVTVGFGAKQSIDDSPLLPMLFVSLGMAFAAFIGVVIGHTNFLLVAMAALWGFGYGMLTTRESGYSWVGQQCVITFLVASAFPASVEAAGDRALLILAGCAIQLISSAILLRTFRQLGVHFVSLARYLRAEETALRAAVLETAQSVRERTILNSALPYSLRLAITLGVTTEIYRRLHFGSGYWIPMTALLVLKPGIKDTASRAIARMIGTLAGAILASFCIAHTTPAPLTLASFTLLFAWLSYGTVNVNYALFSVCVTGYIVFLLSLANVPGPLIAQRRAVCTAIGGLIALGVRLVVISRRKKWWKNAAMTSPQNT